jgi:polar amino acid transport system substrate-binding protein
MRTHAANRPGRSRRLPLAAATLAVSLMVVVSACSSSKSTSTTGTTAAPTTTVPNTPIPTATKDSALAAMVPAKLTSAGKAVVATDASYAPNEFFAPGSSSEIIGMDIDLGHAIGQVIGVPFDFTNASFDTIIPAMGSRYDVSLSSFTDTLERQKQVDMVTYFSAGTSFYVPKGKNSDLGSLDALCGKSVGVEKGTTEATDATTQSATCTKDGKAKVDVVQFPDQNGANVALASGRVDVVMADSPVAAYAVEQSNGQFALAGQPYGTAPYGIVVPKTSDYAGLSNAILGALKDLNSDGIYAKIMTKWGVSSGSITNFQLNGATS